MKKLLLLICLFCPVFSVSGQEAGNLREKLTGPYADTLLIDTLTIIPYSEIIFRSDGSFVPDSLYRIDRAGALLFPGPGLQAVDFPLRIVYRVYPVNFQYIHYRKDLKNYFIMQERGKDPYRMAAGPGVQELPFEGSGLDRRGSISRAITVGNNQDAVVSSNFNLQLAGPLNERLNILAAISDENIPIQPDGASQQIQEFDRVFIRVYNQRLELDFGDLELEETGDGFMQYTRRVKGAGVTYSSGENKTDRVWEASAGGAVSRGKFGRNRFMGQEGNQGPYRLSGNENETYIIILAGSEKVYIDGRLLTRGQENDYTIDYNQAEIAFTPAQPITKDRRILVEFEYSERSYARMVLSSSGKLQTERGGFWVHMLSEQDGKNQPLQQVLSPEQQELLAGIGDRLELARVPNYSPSDFLPDRVLYRRTDTLVGETVYEGIFVLSSDPSAGLYEVGFSYIGPNQGNYVQTASSSNGRAFQWVVPEDGLPRGDFEPVVRLVTPKKKQIISTGGEHLISKRTRAKFEAALSNEDLNTFSSADREDNLGTALRLQLDHTFIERDSGKVMLGAEANFRFISSGFRPPERIRELEFERDWNLLSLPEEHNEQLAGISLRFRKDSLFSGVLTGEYLNRGEDYSGFRTSVSSGAEIKGLELDMAGSWLGSSSNVYLTRFIRYNSTLAKNLSGFRLGLRGEGEMNHWQPGLSDSLLPNSFAWRQWEAFLESTGETEQPFYLGYWNRSDLLPEAGQLVKGTRADELRMNLLLSASAKNRLQAGVSYRSLKVLTDSLNGLRDGVSILGRLQYAFQWFEEAFTGNSYLETGSGQEQKKGYTYLEVMPGQGVYTWKDYNGNGIQELNEFEVARFRDEASFIRITLPSQETVPVTINQFSQVLNLQPARLIKKRSGMAALVARFSNQFAFQLTRKTMDNDPGAFLLPFNTNIGDEKLVGFGSSLRNTLSFDRANPRFGMDYLVQEQKNKVLLINGPETRQAWQQGLKLRIRIAEPVTLFQEVESGEKSFVSEYFSSRGFQLKTIKQQTRLQIQPGLKAGADISYRFHFKENLLSAEYSRMHEMAGELRVNRTGQAGVTATLNYLFIRYNGESNTFLAYEMLEGFLPGQNLSWGIQYRQKLVSGIEIGLDYGGRKASGLSAIHTGSLQARAVF